MMILLIADSQIIPGLVGAVAGTLFLSAVRLVPWMRFVPRDNPDISFEELREKYSATYLLQAAALFVITPLICCVSSNQTRSNRGQ